MSSATKRALLKPIVDDNPVTLHVLGISCSKNFFANSPTGI